MLTYKYALNLLKTNLLETNKLNEIKSTKSSKHFPVSTREWNNSIYVYNKNALSLIPIASNSATKIIKSYFSLFNLDVEKRLRTARLSLKRRKSSSNKIFLGASEFKHTNNKVLIDLYLFNRQQKSYHIILKKKYNYWKKRKIYTPSEKKKRYNIKGVFWKKCKKSFVKKDKRALYFFNRISNSIHNRLKLLRKEHEEKRLFLIKYRDISDLLLKKEENRLETLFIKFKQEFREKMLGKLLLYFYYRQLIYINKAKFNYTFLQNLKRYLQAIYNKDVEFNLINLKRFYLNSDTLTESVKLKLSKNRRRIFRHLSKLKKKVKTKIKFYRRPTPLYKEIYGNLNKTYIQKNIIKTLKYKDITGFRLEAKGRLTRRHTASRSVTKMKYKGNLLNLDSSHRGLSTVLLKGNLESNLQYTKLKSKTRIGSFGLKGWVSGN